MLRKDTRGVAPSGGAVSRDRFFIRNYYGTLPLSTPIRAVFGLHKYHSEGLKVSTLTWDALVSHLDRQRKIWRHRSAKESGAPNGAPWSSPMILGEGTEGRGEDAVIGVSNWTALDHDHGGSEAFARERFAGIAMIGHTTTKSTLKAQRWRYILLLSREVTCEEYAGVWRGINLLCDQTVDQHAKNCNRIFYDPAHWTGSDNQWFVQDGVALDVDAILELCPPEAPAARMPPVELSGMLPMPEGAELVTERMIRDFATAPAGSGRFWHLLLQMATRARHNEWQITDQQLHDEAMQVNDMLGGPKRPGALREAQRAMARILANVTPLDPVEKLKARYQWLLNKNKDILDHAN